MSKHPTGEHPRDIPSPLSPTVESRPGLLRVLGPGMAIAIVVGNVIGSGIFAKPGRIAADAGDFGLIISAWIAAGVICLMGALCFAELAVMLPRAGGLYVYLREAYGRPVAFLFGWSEFLFGRPASVGALSVLCVGSLAKSIRWNPGTSEQILVAVLLIVGMAWVNIVGAIWGGRMQGATTIVKAGFVALVAALPFVLMGMGRSGVVAANYSSTVIPVQTTTAGRFAIVLLSVMWAYNGWHGITPVAEEIRDPQRNIPRALFGGIGLLIVLYVSANIAYYGVLPMERIAAAGDHAAEAVVKSLLGSNGSTIMSLGVVVSTLGAINSNMLLGPRVSFAMGRDDVFFRQLGRVHVNYRTPAVAIAVQGVMAVVLILSAAAWVNTNRPPAVDQSPMASNAAPVPSQQTAPVQRPKTVSGVFEMLTNFVVFSASIFYVLAVAAVVVLRRSHPEWERPYRTFGYPVVPLAYLAFYVWFLYYVFHGKPAAAGIGIVLILAGLPCFYLWKQWAARHPENLRDGQ